MTDTREKGGQSEYLMGRIYKCLSQVMRRDIAYWQCLVMSLNNPTHTMHNQPFIIFRIFIVDCSFGTYHILWQSVNEMASVADGTIRRFSYQPNCKNKKKSFP